MEPKVNVTQAIQSQQPQTSSWLLKVAQSYVIMNTSYLITSPLERLKTIIQTHHQTPLSDCHKMATQPKGLLSLYQGFVGYSLRQNFCSFYRIPLNVKLPEVLHQHVYSAYNLNPFVGAAVTGITAAIIDVTLKNPIETINTKRMAQSNGSYRMILKNMAKQDVLSVFTLGWKANFYRMVPGWTVFYFNAELINQQQNVSKKKWFTRPQPLVLV